MYPKQEILLALNWKSISESKVDFSKNALPTGKAGRNDHKKTSQGAYVFPQLKVRDGEFLL